MKMKLVMAAAMLVTASAWSAEPANTPTPAQIQAQEDTVQQFRNDLMAKRADIMAKGLTLTAEQAAKFWPLFQQFEKEQDAVVKGQIEAIENFASHYQDLSDKDALAYVNSLLDRDQKMHDLRVKWLAKFQTVVPVKIAARAIHLDRRLGQVGQVQISQRIPLIR
jgi:Spy/CpxP family protein refolding chaperone